MKTQFEIDLEKIEAGEYGEAMKNAALINKKLDEKYGIEAANEIINHLANIELFHDDQEDLFNLLVEFLTKKNHEGIEITDEEALKAFQAAKQQVKFFEQ